MKEIRTFDSLSKQCYAFYFEGNVLVRLRSWDYVTLKDNFDEYGEGIKEQHFKRAVKVACKDENFGDFSEFLREMNEDEFHSYQAREIIARQIWKMSERVKHMSEALYHLYY